MDVALVYNTYIASKTKKRMLIYTLWKRAQKNTPNYSKYEKMHVIQYL